MSGLRVLGLIFFWSGFLLAAIAMVKQREIDLLPQVERDRLLALDDEMAIPPDVAIGIASRPVRELDESEFLAALDRWVAWWQASRSKPGQVTDPQLIGTMETAENAAPPDDQGTQSLTESQPGSANGPQPSPPKRAPLTKATLIKHRTERLTNLWPTIAWPPYAGAVVMGLVGVVMLRLSKKRATADPAGQHVGLEQLRRSLANLVVEVQALTDGLPTMSPEAVVSWIDDRCVVHCNDFAENRDLMKERFGLAVFGEIMSEFASGERFLNRVWSAAADGYMEEAYRSVKTSLAFFQAAERLLNR